MLGKTNQQHLEMTLVSVWCGSVGGVQECVCRGRGRGWGDIVCYVLGKTNQLHLEVTLVSQNHTGVGEGRGMVLYTIGAWNDKPTTLGYDTSKQNLCVWGWVVGVWGCVCVCVMGNVGRKGRVMVTCALGVENQ